MTDVSRQKALILDYGYSTYLAERLAREYAHVWYARPWEDYFPTGKKLKVGSGFKEYERILDFDKYKDKADIIIFPALYQGTKQEALRKEGHRVFGSGKSEILEIEKWLFKNLLISGSGDEDEELLKEFGLDGFNLGLRIVPTTRIIGIEDLKEYLKDKKNLYIKTCTRTRGDWSTTKYIDWKKFKTELRELEFNIEYEAETKEFLVEPKVKVDCETGYDEFQIDGKSSPLITVGYEEKDEAWIGKVFKLEDLPKPIEEIRAKMAPVYERLGYRGIHATEIQIQPNGKLLFIDDTCRCYSDDTEILTNHGWKLFKDLDKTETVATLNPKTLCIEYHTPELYQVIPYKGDMVNITNVGSIRPSVDVLVTPDHPMWAWTRKDSGSKRKLIQMPAGSLKGKLSIPRTGTWKGHEAKTFPLPAYSITWHSGKGKGIDRTYSQEPREIQMDSWLRFLASYLSEGSTGGRNHSYANIAQKDKKKEVAKIIEDIGFEYSYKNNSFQISNIQLASYLKQFGRCNEKFVPDFVKELSPRQINIFLNTYTLFDGCIDSKARHFYTTSKRLADDLQELIFKCGGLANRCIHRSKGTIMKVGSNKEYVRNHDVYILHERVGDKDFWLDASNRKNLYIQLVHYTGKVYDVTVKNHIIYVRRNGKPFWSSNCPSPPGEAMSELYTNLGEIYWDVANGEVPKMKTAGKYAGQINVHSEWLGAENYTPVEYEKKDARWVKLHNNMIVEGEEICIPFDKEKTLGAIVAVGDSIEEVKELCLERAERFWAHKLSYRADSFDKIIEAIECGKKHGIDLT